MNCKTSWFAVQHPRPMPPIPPAAPEPAPETRPGPYSIKANRGHFHVLCDDLPIGGCYDEAGARAEAERGNARWQAERLDRIALLEGQLSTAEARATEAERLHLVAATQRNDALKRCDDDVRAMDERLAQSDRDITMWMGRALHAESKLATLLSEREAMRQAVEALPTDESDYGDPIARSAVLSLVSPKPLLPADQHSNPHPEQPHD
jgi:hypothetical protein